MDSSETIGVAGCGRMGLPMARALTRAGLKVAGFDIRPLTEFGDFAPAMIVDPAAFAQASNTLLTVVRDIAQTEALLFEDQALLRHPNSIRTLVICSTVSPRYIHDLRSRVPAHIAMIDAPMSGAAIAAEEERLSFMLGGAIADLDRLDPLFRAMGRDIHRIGALGAGMTAKVLNNLVAANSAAATRTALGWAEGLGVSRDALLAVMNDSSGQTWFGSNFDQIEFARDGHDPDNTIAILVKDVASALDAAPAGADPDLAEALMTTLRNLKPID